MESPPAPDNDQVLRAFSQLLVIMDELREKCPWDQQQTMESLRHLTIEETFELSEAILEGDMEEIKKEFDLLSDNAKAGIALPFVSSFRYSLATATRF